MQRHATCSFLPFSKAKIYALSVATLVCFVVVLVQLGIVSENSLRPETITSEHPTFNSNEGTSVMNPPKKNYNDMNDELARKMTPLIFAKNSKNSSCVKLLSILTPFAANEYSRTHDSRLDDDCERPELTFHIPELVTNATSYSGPGTINVPTNPSHWNVFASTHDTSKTKWLPGDETIAASHVGEALYLNDKVTNNTMLRLPRWSLWENVCATSWNGPLLWVLPSTTSNETLNRLNSELSACRKLNPSGCLPNSRSCQRCQNPLVRTIVSGLSRRIQAKFVRSSAKIKKAPAIFGNTLMFDFWLSPGASAHIAHYTFKLGEAFELGLMSSISPIPDIQSVLFRDTWNYEYLKSTMSPWVRAFDAATWAVTPFNNGGSGKVKMLSLPHDFPGKLVCFERLLWRSRYGEYFHTTVGSVAMQSLMLRMLNNPVSAQRLTGTPQQIPNITQIMEHTLDDALRKVHKINQGKMCPPSTILVAHRGDGRNGRRAFYNREEVIATIANVTGFPRTSIKEIAMTSRISALDAASAWSNAGLIVTPHGSQLVNIISGSPGSVVLEVAPTISRDFAQLTQTSGGTHIYSQGHRPFPMTASLSEAYDACVPGVKPTCAHKFNQRLKLINAMKINLSTFRKDLKFAMEILAKQCEHKSSAWVNRT